MKRAPATGDVCSVGVLADMCLNGTRGGKTPEEVRLGL